MSPVDAADALWPLEPSAGPTPGMTAAGTTARVTTAGTTARVTTAGTTAATNGAAVNGGPAPARRVRGARRSAETSAEPVVVVVRVPHVTAVLWIVVLMLVVLDFVVSIASALSILPYTITRFFDGDAKVNFPTAAKTTLLLAAVILLLGCWTAGRRRQDPAARGWLMLALVTAYAFMDESTFLHQSLAMVIQDKFHFTGLLKYSWTIVYLPAALLVGLFLLRNLRQLQPAVRNRLLPGGGVYAAGAMLLEPIKGHLADAHGDGSLAFKLVAAVSDSMELIGLALLVSALLVAAREVGQGFLFALQTADDAWHPGPIRGRPDARLTR